MVAYDHGIGCQHLQQFGVGPAFELAVIQGALETIAAVEQDKRLVLCLGSVSCGLDLSRDPRVATTVAVKIKLASLRVNLELNPAGIQV